MEVASTQHSAKANKKLENFGVNLYKSDLAQSCWDNFSGQNSLGREGYFCLTIPEDSMDPGREATEHAPVWESPVLQSKGTEKHETPGRTKQSAESHITGGKIECAESVTVFELLWDVKTN